VEPRAGDLAASLRSTPIGSYIKHFVIVVQESIVQLVEDVFDPPSLRTTNESSASLENASDFTQSPRKFEPIPAKYSKSSFQRQPPSNIPVDTN
jgi:hypothetical protein